MSINQYLKPFDQNSQLRDYRHAARIFVDDNYRLMPKYGFLFHVAFDLNPEVSRVYKDQAMEIGLMVKTVNLPKFTVDTKTLNAYNKPNVVQTKIKYDPVTIAFHDDSADVIREFWYDYYHYYYRDSDHQEPTYQAATKYNARQTDKWGYTPRSYPFSSPGTQQYIKSIRIYSLHQKRFSEYTLINPTITSFSHGQHQTGGSELVQSDMTLSYESIKYATGYVSSITVEGFADLHYDQRVSDITPKGGPDIVAGKDGDIQKTDTIIHDLADTSLLTYALRGIQNGQGLGRMVGGILQPGIGAALNTLVNGGGLINGLGLTIPTSGELLLGGLGLASTAADKVKGLFGGNGKGVTSDGASVFKEAGSASGTPTEGFPGDNPVGIQTFDDGSSIQTFEDGSTLITDADGNVTSTPADGPTPLDVKTEQVDVQDSWWEGDQSGADTNEPANDTSSSPDFGGGESIPWEGDW